MRGVLPRAGEGRPFRARPQGEVRLQEVHPLLLLPGDVPGEGHLPRQPRGMPHPQL